MVNLNTFTSIQTENKICKLKLKGKYDNKCIKVNRVYHSVHYATILLCFCILKLCTLVILFSSNIWKGAQFNTIQLLEW
jgi:hypothetical protein